MTYDDLKLDDGQILDVLAVARAHGAMAMIHAENADCIEWLTAASKRPAAPRRASTRMRGRCWWSARPRTAPSRWPSWSTCRS
jgi:dihydropyrimidinase